jgi:hypothetical protein
VIRSTRVPRRIEPCPSPVAGRNLGLSGGHVRFRTNTPPLPDDAHRCSKPKQVCAQYVVEDHQRVVTLPLFASRDQSGLLSTRTNAARTGLAIELDPLPGSPSQWRPQPSCPVPALHPRCGQDCPARPGSATKPVTGGPNVSTNRGPAHPRRGWGDSRSSHRLARPLRKLTNHGYGAHVLLSGVVESREKGGSGSLLRLTQLH